MIGCGEIHIYKDGRVVKAVDLRPTGEILVGSNPTPCINCFENLQDPENNICVSFTNNALKTQS